MLAYITLKALLLHPPQAIVIGWHGRDFSYGVILKQETTDLMIMIYNGKKWATTGLKKLHL